MARLVGGPICGKRAGGHSPFAEENCGQRYLSAIIRSFSKIPRLEQLDSFQDAATTLAGRILRDQAMLLLERSCRLQKKAPP